MSSKLVPFMAKALDLESANRIAPTSGYVDLIKSTGPLPAYVLRVVAKRYNTDFLIPASNITMQIMDITHGGAMDTLDATEIEKNTPELAILRFDAPSGYALLLPPGYAISIIDANAPPNGTWFWQAIYGYPR